MGNHNMDIIHRWQSYLNYSKETLPLLYMEQNNGLQNTDAGNIQVLSDSAPVLHSLFCWIKIFLLHQRGALNCTSDHSSAAMRILRRNT